MMRRSADPVNLIIRRILSILNHEKAKSDVN